MNDHLLIIGAGYAGLRIAQQAIAAGYAVSATTRDSEQHRALEAVGARVIDWSVGDVIDVLPLDDQHDVVYSVPPIDVRPPLELLAANRRFVYLSSTSVYGNHDGALVDEASPRRPTSPVGRARKAIEDQVLASEYDACVVRIVGIYGPGRTLDRYIGGGRYKLVDGGVKLTNRIHVDDLARVVIAALRQGKRGQAYIAADGNPVRVCDLVDWLVEHVGIERPIEVTLAEYRAERGDDAAERWANSYTASNARIRAELGVELRYPDVFAGYREIFGVSG